MKLKGSTKQTAVWVGDFDWLASSFFSSFFLSDFILLLFYRLSLGGSLLIHGSFRTDKYFRSLFSSVFSFFLFVLLSFLLSIYLSFFLSFFLPFFFKHLFLFSVAEEHAKSKLRRKRQGNRMSASTRYWVTFWFVRLYLLVFSGWVIHYGFKQEFTEDKIKIQWMVMGSPTSLWLIGGELIYIQLKVTCRCMAELSVIDMNPPLSL